MKFTRLQLIPVLMGLVVVPASADDRYVPQSTLHSLGLGRMQVISDESGMQIRGKSSSVQGTSFSMFSAALFDPFSGSNFTSAGANLGAATDENGGFMAMSSVGVSSAAVNGAFNASIATGANIWTANIGILQANGAAMSMSGGN